MSDQANHEGLARLVAIVLQHYADGHQVPLLLSTLGQRNKDLVASLRKDFGSLKEAILSLGEDDIRIVGTTPGSEVVAPAAIASTILLELQQHVASQRESAEKFDGLPKSVQLAFCIRIASGEQVAIDLVPPFRYSKVSSMAELGPNQRLIGEAYRHPGLSLRTASPQEREQLWRRFLAWSTENDVPSSHFHHREHLRVPTTHANALGRLIAAQPKEILDRMVIPADVAQVLMAHA
ncbi:hypothetical protein [Aureimonas phyllosphaerae]|uniref:Uncharacterized protein n=1 Tax=Aureimonas phyllosphaerae TaxID=1166078 RepID=A0A7W6FVU9_9HYPH|nr:hypothetical protein [Aureimonas phyllosphaerae]MBB3937215.1 hypothetical protein [Aureimonas phyllosphaerae]MBB3961148.1 hypothetical protein [Aureimonas phyllosphaerae]